MAVETLLPAPRAQNGEERNSKVWLRPDGEPQNLENALAHAPIAAGQLLPTPTSRDYKDGAPCPNVDENGLLGRVVWDEARWGRYAAAIARHEAVFGRPAPAPTDDERRLSPRFVEWMMMLPAGWVTDCDISRSAQLRILGNGVVPPQAALARRMLDQMSLPAAHIDDDNFMERR